MEVLTCSFLEVLDPSPGAAQSGPTWVGLGELNRAELGGHQAKHRGQ